MSVKPNSLLGFFKIVRKNIASGFSWLGFSVHLGRRIAHVHVNQIKVCLTY